MGWLFFANTRGKLIEELTKASESEFARRETVKYTLRGNVLWSIVRVTPKANTTSGNEQGRGETTTYIACDLLQKNDGQWGYKGLNESMYPYYYTCPLSYLEMVPPVCPEWRANVRNYHQNRKAKKSRPILVQCELFRSESSALIG